MSRTTYIFMPPLPRFSGGMAVLLRVAEHLHAAGLPVRLVLREKTSALPHLAVPVLLWEALRLSPDDLWLVPEGWPTALLPGLQAGARCVLYVQNWAFLLGNMPGGDQEWSRLVASGAVEMLAVSDPVAWFVEQLTGVRPAILRPAIDPALFHPGPPDPDLQSRSLRNGLRVAWMPRKNKALARQIRCMVEARNRLPVPLEWVEIHDLPPEGVAERLRSAHMFLATGFPEGCPLPPLEALASGCVVAGFSGLGGWDYMRQCGAFPGACRPWWPLRRVEFGGNGFYAADADVPAAAMALEWGARMVLGLEQGQEQEQEQDGHHSAPHSVMHTGGGARMVLGLNQEQEQEQDGHHSAPHSVMHTGGGARMVLGLDQDQEQGQEQDGHHSAPHSATCIGGGAPSFTAQQAAAQATAAAYAPSVQAAAVAALWQHWGFRGSTD